METSPITLNREIWELLNRPGTYRQYARDNGHSDTEIDNEVGGLFDPDIILGKPVEITVTNIKYRVGSDLFLYSNNSTFDVVRHEENGDMIEEWNLEY